MTFPEKYQQQIERVEKLQKYGEEIGPAGTFYVAVCKDVKRRAIKAAAEHDTAAMAAIYKEMQEIEE